MSKQSTKKLSAIITGLLLVIQIGLVGSFNIPQAQAASYIFSDGFSTTLYKDSANTIADWDTEEGKIQLPLATNVVPKIDLSWPDYNGGERIYVTWRSAEETEIESGNGDIYVQKLQYRTGNREWDNDVRVSSDIFAAGDKSMPNIAVGGQVFDDKATIVWWDKGTNRSVDLPAGNTIDNTGSDNGPFAVSQRLCSGIYPAVAVSSKSGTYYSYIVWQDYRDSRDGEDFNIYMQKFDENGVEIWPNAIKVDTITNGDQTNPVIATDNEENIYIAWQGPEGIYAQKYDKEGNKLWNNDVDVDLKGGGVNPDIAVDYSSGNVHIVYSTITHRTGEAGKWSVANTKLDTNGNGLATHIKTTETTSPGYPHIDLDYWGNVYIAGQKSNGDIYVQKLDSLGVYNQWNSDLIIDNHLSEGINDILYAPDIGVYSWGDIYVVWPDGRNGGLDIYAQIYDKDGDKLLTDDIKVNEDVYATSAVAQSTKINTITDAITKATLTTIDSQPTNTSITYYLSADGGTNWEQTTPNKEHSFVYPGSDLRWKAILSITDTGATPYVLLITISYITETEEDTTPPTLPMNISITWPGTGFEEVLNISWTDPTNSDFDHVNTYRSTVSGQLGDLIKTTPKGSEGFINTGLNSDTIYYYTFRSVDTSGNESTNTNQHSGTPSATTVNEPVIINISPSQGQQGETVDVVITGSNFTDASNYSDCGISPVSSSGFQLSSCDQVSDTQINASFSIDADATTGSRNITVQTPNGTSNAVTFTVVSLTPTPTPIPTPTPTPTPTECLPDGTIIKLPDDPKIYVIINCQKKWIETIEEFQQEGYQWSDVQEVSSEVVNAYADYLEAVVNLIRTANQSKVYKIINNKRLWIPTAESFTAMGNDWSDIQDVNESEVNQYPRLKLTKIASDERVYYLTEGGLKRHIPSVGVFDSYDNNWADIVEITSTELNAYPDSILIRLTGDPKVYKLENNQKRWIKTDEAFNRLGLNWDEIAPVNTIEIDTYTEGTAIE